MNLKAQAMLSGLASLSISVVAQAGWRYTTWDMNQTQVEAASKDQLRRSAPEGADGQVRGINFSLEGTHEVAGSVFEVALGFDSSSHKLSIVNLSSTDKSACASALIALKNRAAPEVESASEGSEQMTWRDDDEGNLINFRGNQVLNQYSSKEPYCYIQYRPLRGKDVGL